MMPAMMNAYSMGLVLVNARVGLEGVRGGLVQAFGVERTIQGDPVLGLLEGSEGLGLSHGHIEVDIEQALGNVELDEQGLGVGHVRDEGIVEDHGISPVVG